MDEVQELFKSGNTFMQMINNIYNTINKREELDYIF